MGIDDFFETGTCEMRRNAAKTGECKMRRSTPMTGVLVAAAGILLMVFGIFRGEMSTVCSKAIQICLECIGIG